MSANAGDRLHVSSRRRAWWVLAGLVTMPAVVDPSPAAAGRQERLAGYVERVRIDPGGLALPAGIETGAKHASLDAKNMARARSLLRQTGQVPASFSMRKRWRENALQFIENRGLTSARSIAAAMPATEGLK